jgi:hypothetical protein
MAEKCVTCGLVFRTSSELDWHIREEHTRRAMARPRADGDREPEVSSEREPAATSDEPAGRPGWLRAARRLFGRRPPQSPTGEGRGKA